MSNRRKTRNRHRLLGSAFREASSVSCTQEAIWVTFVCTSRETNDESLLLSYRNILSPLDDLDRLEDWIL
jgi:hypothetical protein